MKDAIVRAISTKLSLDNQVARDEWVIKRLAELTPGSRILDAGCGSQRYREHCAHLEYRGQDFGEYTTDAKTMMGGDGAPNPTAYPYGVLDYVSDIWDIPAESGTFDAVLCTEVLEHVPYPIASIRELSRLLKPGGILILTVPSNCLRHMDPYFFTSGFSDRWLERMLPEVGFESPTIEPLGDYYSWMKVEVARTAGVHSWGARVLLIPALLYFSAKKATPSSTDALTMGYLVTARKSSS